MTGSTLQKRIRELNDEFRTAGPTAATAEQWLVTRGVVELAPYAAIDAVRCVRAFAGFARGDDPYAEHDFGAFELLGRKVFWKIDYYDQTRSGRSPDPADPAQTTRILTIMLSQEY